MKNLIPIIFFVLLAFSGINLKAQTPFAGFEHNHQFFWTQTIYNPAYAGHYSQPTFYTVAQLGKANSASPQLYNVAWQSGIDNIGFGIIANYSNIDPDNSARMALLAGQFSMEFDAFENLNARAGLGFGALHYKNDVVDPLNPQANQGQQIENNESFAKYNADIGILIYNDNFRLGIAMIHNNQPEFNFFNANYVFQNWQGTLSAVDRKTIFRNRNYITLGFDVNTDSDLVFTPSILARVYALSYGTGANFAGRNNNDDDFRLDANVTAAYREQLYLGVSYFQDVNYLIGVNAAYRTIGGFQISGLVSIPKGDTPEGFSQFELGLGWFPQWEDY